MSDVNTGQPLMGDEAPPAAADPAAAAEGDNRIALALGGGAARGWAHIGVIRAFEAAGWRPSVIAGTSIGAVVGGLYAAGRLDALEAWARSLNRRRVLRLIDITLGGGLLAGNRLADLIWREVEDTRIEALPLRFAAVASEIGKGHEIWLTRGQLLPALRASYALPGVFEPVQIGGRWLMDGAMVNPVPVTVARAIGGRLVVGVTLSGEGYGRGTVIQDHGSNDDDDERTRNEIGQQRGAIGLAKRMWRGDAAAPPDGPPRLTRVAAEAYSVMQDRITRTRLAGDPPDVSVFPRVGKLALFDFHRAEELIQLGYEAAERALPALIEARDALAEPP